MDRDLFETHLGHGITFTKASVTFTRWCSRLMMGPVDANEGTVQWVWMYFPPVRVFVFVVFLFSAGSTLDTRGPLLSSGSIHFSRLPPLYFIVLFRLSCGFSGSQGSSVNSETTAFNCQDQTMWLLFGCKHFFLPLEPRSFERGNPKIHRCL